MQILKNGVIVGISDDLLYALMTSDGWVVILLLSLDTHWLSIVLHETLRVLL